MDPLLIVCADLQLDSRTVEAAKDVERMMSLKLQNGSLRGAEHCRHVIAVDIAASTGTASFKRECLLKHSGLSYREYNQALIVCRNTLGIKSTENVIESLSVRLGCDSSVGEAANKLICDYATKYVSTLDPVVQANTKLDSSVFQAAAFLFAARAKKISVDKRKVIEVSGVQSSVFNSVFDSICKYTGSTITSDVEMKNATQRLSLGSKKLQRVLQTENIENECTLSVNTRVASTSGFKAIASGATNTVEKRNVLLDKSLFRDAIADLTTVDPMNSTTSVILTIRQQETLKTVQEHNREAAMLLESIKIAELAKFEKFKQHVTKKRKLFPDMNVGSESAGNIEINDSEFEFTTL